MFKIFKKKHVGDPQTERRRLLLEIGRVTDGKIIDNDTTSAGEEIVYYLYTLNGVDFESSEMLSEEQRSDPLRYAPGATVGVRYDPKNQGNSMLV